MLPSDDVKRRQKPVATIMDNMKSLELGLNNLCEEQPAMMVWLNKAMQSKA
ncbi:MAG: hypothetical protein ACYSTS_09365 [Planctomycetota bacterium]|jgi:hypothetical protein